MSVVRKIKSSNTAHQQVSAQSNKKIFWHIEGDCPAI